MLKLLYSGLFGRGPNNFELNTNTDVTAFTTVLWPLTATSVLVFSSTFSTEDGRQSTAETCAAVNSTGPVSYTHLDVAKV